jgi:hypothetical protein
MAGCHIIFYLESDAVFAMGLLEVQRSKAFLTLLSTCEQRQRKALLQSASKSQYLALCEVLLNIIRGVTPLDSDTVDKLQRSRGVLRDWTNRKIGRTSKTQSFIRNQKLLPLILKNIERIVGA